MKSSPPVLKCNQSASQSNNFKLGHTDRGRLRVSMWRERRFVLACLSAVFGIRQSAVNCPIAHQRFKKAPTKMSGQVAAQLAPRGGKSQTPALRKQQMPWQSSAG